MPNSLNLTFLSSADGVRASDVYDNYRYSLAVLQVSGNFSGASVIVEGRVDREADWETLAAMNMSDTAMVLYEITRVGIYEVSIDGIAQIRLRLAALGGGTITVSGTLYDSSDDSIYPDTAVSIRFGDPNLFVKGVAEQIYMDPLTGNIVGYDRTSADSAVTMSVTLSEVTGGMGNKLLGVLPDTTRVTGSYTSAAFSLETRRLITGGALAYDAICPVCETITAESTTLTVTKTPVPSYEQDPDAYECWCHVSEKDGGPQKGANYGIDRSTKEVLYFLAEAGKTYEVTYYVHNTSAYGMTVPNFWNPVVMTVQTRYGVYGKQGKNEKQGILKGWLYFIVPRAILTANAGFEASQTATGGTDGSWLALSNRQENMPYCRCDTGVTPIAYYVYVPCGDETVKVQSLVITGGGLMVQAGKEARLPLKMVMADDTLLQPDFSRLNYSSSDDSVATVDGEGMVFGESAGEAIVVAYLTKADGNVLFTSCHVAVTGTRNTVTHNPNNIRRI